VTTRDGLDTPLFKSIGPENPLHFVPILLTHLCVLFY
jgi:hypothetical protein